MLAEKQPISDWADDFRQAKGSTIETLTEKPNISAKDSSDRHFRASNVIMLAEKLKLSDPQFTAVGADGPHMVTLAEKP